MAKMKGPEFVQYFAPLLEALRTLGGSGRPREVYDTVAEITGTTDEQRAEMLPSGTTSRFSNRVAWARFYLVQAGLIDASKRGVWSLTEAGQNRHLNTTESLHLFRTIHSSFKGAKEVEDKEDEAAPELQPTDHRTLLLQTLKGLPPSGFERLCQRLLRESGFEEVVVTGKSGDGGIDGHGVLQVNLLVSFRVLFQCKRYEGNVSSGEVRNFRGAMTGRTDKGILITTGGFTPDAQKEAFRDGAPPIELVNGDKLVSMFESLELGLKPRRAFDLDDSFFDEYR